MQVVVVAVHQGHAHARVGHVEVVVSVSGNHHVFTGADGPRGGVTRLVAHDGVGIKVQGFGCAGGHLPAGQIHVNGTAVVEFKPLAVRVGSGVKAVRVGDDLVDADITRARCRASVGVLGGTFFAEHGRHG